MKIYVRKIDKQAIEKQLSYTKEVLKDFLGGLSDHDTILCEGKMSHEQVNVTLLLATDPRFDNSIQKLLKKEGTLEIGDIMVMHKLSSKYLVELIKPIDKSYNTLLKLFSDDRHLLLDVDDIDDKNSLCVNAAWYVGATGHDENGIYTDFSGQYIEEGRWENRYDHKYTDIVNTMQVGDRIVIKSSYTKKNNLPFDNHGKIISVMAIKAIGTITKNYGDGKNIDVDWEKVEPIKEWFGDGVLRTTVHYIEANDNYIKKALLSFTFDNVPQDFSIYEDNIDEIDDTELDENPNAVVLPRIELNFTTNIDCAFERNRIVFGAPGTGKSFQIEEDRKKILAMGGGYERITFHPDYTYSNFVGCYKPIPKDDKSITYDFVPGPFMRVLVAALKSGLNDLVAKPYLLVIEEINRAKVAAVFGEVFQLLDRDKNGASDYEIHTSEDVRKWLAKELHGSPDCFEKIRIPNNMFIWATMNSADQGVFPMDTAFKRRWSFEYKGIDENEDKVGGNIILGKGSHAQKVNWNTLRKAINEVLSTNFKVNEDKLIGPFFIDEKVFAFDENGDIINPEMFIQVFKSKVIMYLFEDAAKQPRAQLFSGCKKIRYSLICNDFDEIGIEIFSPELRDKYKELE